MTKITKEILERYSKNEKETNYIKIGMTSCGMAAGALEIYDGIKKIVKEKNIDIKVKKCGCMGMCFAEPIVELKIDDEPIKFYKNVKVNMIEAIILNQQEAEKYLVKENPKQKKIVLRNCGKIDPEIFESYLENQGYQGLNKAFFELGRDNVLNEIKTSGLRGRGGAGFPTWKKWEASKNIESEEKIIICNGDEGDPGAYMDRSVLESDPHSVIEGMLIAGYVVGATHGVFYIRAEYPLAIKRMQNAIDQCYERGLFGKNILESEFSFDAEIRLGAGAFVCGEETALIASIEGRRGYPRPRPPFPAIQGLWGKPTVINNVETLANIPYIITHGGANYAEIGTEDSKGTKVFALTGKIKKSGLIEVPMGTTLKEIIEDIGGGVLNDKKLKAIQTGGPSGGLIPAKFLKTPVSYENLKALGSIMGSGGMIVLSEDDCIVDIAKFFINFCVDESCGKCAPCRIGSSQLFKILDRISKGRGKITDLEKLKRISKAMQMAALCGLGQSAPNPVLSSLNYFEDEYLEHINQKKCKAGKCSMQ